ncbi:xylulokinase [Allobranchiibius huperziae]|uniref:Xylulokinase n=1 Tax=Allobranchiibius huperziae TaxID=1874116 RepID=A0A853DE33_9MICO|nr:xylulokinase [Allobranchiibius huperziae]
MKAISVAAQCHGLVAMDADGAVIRPAKLWNDTTSAPEMAWLLRQLPPAEWARRTGSVPTAAFTVSKLLWLRRHEPAHFAALATVLLPHDWLTWRLTGRKVSDRSEASGTGYFDASTGRYDTAILALIDDDVDWTPRVPTVLDPQTPAGHISAEASRALGLGQDTVVGPGAGDQHASALGLGARTGDVVYVFGTSGVVFTTTDEPIRDSSGMVDGVADAAGGYLPLVSTLNAAKVTDTIARLLGVDHDEFARLALAGSAHATTLVPYLDGERKPNLPHATGTLTGLSNATTREDLARAAVEGVVFGLFRGQEALQSAGAPLGGRTIVTGGAGRSPAYRQVLSDLTGRTVYVSPAHEPVADGAALQALACWSGRSITEVRNQLASDPIPDLEPRSVTGRDAYARYLSVSNWRGGDTREHP